MLRRFTERRQVHPWTAPPGTCGRPCPSARSSWRAPCRGRPHPAKMHQRRAAVTRKAACALTSAAGTPPRSSPDSAASSGFSKTGRESDAGAAAKAGAWSITRPFMPSPIGTAEGRLAPTTPTLYSPSASCHGLERMASWPSLLKLRARAAASSACRLRIKALLPLPLSSDKFERPRAMWSEGASESGTSLMGTTRSGAAAATARGPGTCMRTGPWP